MSTKARLDSDRTEKPLTRLVAKVPGGAMHRTNATHYEGADGQRVALQSGPDRGPSALYGAMFDACAAIGLNAGIREDAQGRVWVGSWCVENTDGAIFAVRKGREVHTFDETTPRGFRSAVAMAIRGHVAERMAEYERGGA